MIHTLSVIHTRTQPYTSIHTHTHPYTITHTHPPAGYEWSKYNQTHYDYDNPPPKVVQGYKFNILYHDLVDRNVVSC